MTSIFERSVSQSFRLRLITRAWHASLLLLALMLPFELRTPWLDVRGSLAFTNLELVALLALMLWAARQWALGSPPNWRVSRWLGLSIVLMSGILLLASLFAPNNNLNAFKVTGRWLAGVAVGWMAVEAVVSGLAARRIAQASVLSGILVALLTILEVNAGPINSTTIQTLLQPFRVDPVFRVGGEVRPSATLGYPTITAMYLEMIFFFAMGWLAEAWAQRRWWRGALLLSALLLIGEALILTLTRSAFVAIALAAITVVLARWPRVRLDAFARAATLATASVGLLLLLSVVANPVLRLRLASESDRDWYRAEYGVSALPPLRAGETITLDVAVRNIGLRAWDAQGPSATYLLYHWLSADGQQLVVVTGGRTPIPRAVAPGETLVVRTTVQSPERAGDYLLAWDMLRDGLFWFSTLGAPMHEMRAQVLPGGAVAPATEAPVVPNSTAVLNADRATLWRIALQMLAAHPLLGVGPGNYRLVLGQYLHVPEWDKRLHANNTYLEYFADAGLLGGIAFLLFALAVAHVAWRALRMRARSVASVYNAALAGALAAFFIHAVSDYFLEFTPIYVLLWLTLGLLVTHDGEIAAESRA